ncbi:MAG: ABC transporter ATP-binding protein, partial [Firmicutes bacterium]|nr:ABC transporter ATP-binding protein [Bacillota bacterium]
ELKSDIHKIQVAFRGSAPEGIYDGLNILHKESRGSVDLLIVRNRRDLVEQQIEAANPAIFDLLPLSLEEIFIYELGGETIELESLLF